MAESGAERDAAARAMSAGASRVAVSGIVLFVMGLFCASIQAGMSKYLTASLPLLLIVWGRFAVFLVISLSVALWRHGPAELVPPQPHLHALRGLLLMAASVAFIGAIAGIPLANAISIVFIYPFIVTALAPWLLRERVPHATWIAIATGFIGVLVVIRPGWEGIDWHALLALAAGSCFAIHLLITRRLTASAAPLITANATAFVGTACLSLALPFVWEPLTWNQIGILLLMGSFASASQLFTILGCSKTEMSTLAPFGYTEIIGATTVGYLMFGDFPDAMTWLGIAIIVLSGLYIAARTRRTRVQLISRTRPPAT